LLKLAPQWIGVLGALWAVVAEIYGKELWDLKSFGNPEDHYYPLTFQSVFHTAVRERKGTAFTERTKELLNLLWKDEQDKKLAILISSSCVPGHSWNADFIARRLLSLTSEEQDSAWSHWFEDNQSELINRAREITDWALNVDALIADAEVVRLAVITLTCFLITANPTIVERATQGLTNLMSDTPSLLLDLENRFLAVDNPEFQNRLSYLRTRQSFK
jgi:hypothetical protein